MTKRLDFLGRFDGKARTPQGGLRVAANLTRTGIFLYRNDRGDIVREYRPASEVFKADSLETLKLAPLTIGHPDMVRTDNFQKLSVGVVAENVRPNGTFVSSDVLIQDRQTCDGVEDGSLVELSCGYEVDLLHEPGTTPEGDRYDAIQTNIRYNHVGIGPAAWGRAGKDVKLRLDGGEDVAIRLDASGDAIPAHYSLGMTVKTDAEVISGARFDAERTRADKAEAALDAAKSELEKLQAKCDGLVSEMTRVKTDTSNLIDPKTIPSLIAARVSLETSARAILGADAKLEVVRADGKTEPMTDAEVIEATLAKHDPSIKIDGKSSDYLRARFDFACESASKSSAAVAGLNVASTPKGAPEGEKSRLDKAYETAETELQSTPANAPPPGAMVRKH